jgi:NADH-quinone oxidoreductase subunit M
MLLVLPFLGALLALVQPRRARPIAIATMLALAALGAWAVLRFSLHLRTLQFVEKTLLWRSGTIEFAYHVGVDGISLPLVLLTILLGIVAVLISGREISSGEGPYYALLLALVGSIIGVFASVNLVFFFLFWEIVLVLMFLLVLRWGAQNRSYAAMRFLIYTGLGSAALLLAIILLATFAGSVSLVAIDPAVIPHGVQYALLGLLLFAFCVKMPIVPLHSWLPDAHVQAPTAGSVLLAGVLLKMGAYGIIRLCITLFGGVTPALGPVLFALGTFTILYGAFVCLSQTHLKRLIAYSSITHMGMVLVGISTGSALGITGAVVGMVSHGLLAGLLFALAGFVHSRTGTFEIDELRGLASRMPRTAWLLAVAALGAMGLPGMTGFVAEFLVLLASFGRFGAWALLPLLGVLLTGAYVVRLLARAVFGEPAGGRAMESDASSLPFGILLAATLILGIAPSLITSIVAASALT